jgi:4-amino-4-deoxy-L-arabinose transferase-like glycosyltransferase
MRREASRPGSDRELLGLLLLTVAVTLPFVGQAFHIDDPTFLAIARQLARDPWRPYSFSINWLGSERPAFTILANPPLVPAYIALARSVLGESEVALHAAFIPIALLAAWGVWRCAGCFVRHRATAAALFLVTPAFVVSSHTLMPDVALVALAAHAVASVVSGFRARRSLPVALGAFVAGLAFLTRYNGLVLIPLFLVAWWLHRRGNEWRVAWVAVPLAVAGLWTWHNVAVYGAPHVLAAASVQGLRGGAVFAKATATVSYLGGAGVFPLAVLALAAAQPALRGPMATSVVSAVPVALVAGWLYLQSPTGTLALLVLLASAGVYLAAAVQLIRRGLAPVSGNAEAWLLGAWLGGVLLFNQLLLFASVRYLLPAILPAVLALVRVTEGEAHGARSVAWLRIAAGLTLALALGLSVGDMQLAGAGRTAASALGTPADGTGPTRWFVGHWGFQYYMERTGARALDAAADSLPPGDLLVLSRYADPHRIHGDLWPRLRPLRIVEVPSRWPVRTLSHRVPGFFHANRAPLGPDRSPVVFLPYAFSTEPLDRLYLYRVSPPPPKP